jgi:hypothetical protein
MNTRYIIVLLIALVTVRLEATAQTPPKKEDIVCLVYEFDLTPDGKAHHVKVSQVFWQKDHRDASSVLTDAEKARGATSITSHPYHPRPDHIGKKRYDFVLFDTKSRQFNRGLGHTKV